MKKSILFFLVWLAMSVCQAATHDGYTVFVLDHTGWESTALYAWGTAELYGKWPGIYPIDTKTIEGVTYKVFPYDITEAGSYNLIFNNGNNGEQAADFNANEVRDYYLVLADKKVTEQGTDINTPEHTDATVARKVLRDGHIYIIRGGNLYTLSGTRL